MKTLHSVIAIGLVGCLLAFPLVEARALQEAQQPAEPGITDWNNLQQLNVGDKVEVVHHNLSKYKGKVLAWTEEAISLRTGGQDVTIPREEVYRVTQLSKGHRGRNVLISLGLGAAVGTLIGRAQWCSGEPGLNACTFVGLVMGSGIGAGVGAAFPGHPTIYRASHKDQEEHSEAQPAPLPGKQAVRSDVQKSDLIPSEKREGCPDAQGKKAPRLLRHGFRKLGRTSEVER